MLTITPKHKIYLAIKPIDFRCGIDGIVALCRYVLQLNPLSGHLFIFRNRRGQSIKILTYDTQGFWLMHKRLSSGTFSHWPKSPEAVAQMTATQLHVLLNNGDPLTVHTAPVWHPYDSDLRPPESAPLHTQ
jgi:transposase